MREAQEDGDAKDQEQFHLFRASPLFVILKNCRRSFHDDHEFATELELGSWGNIFLTNDDANGIGQVKGIENGPNFPPHFAHWYSRREFRLLLCKEITSKHTRT